MKFRKVVTITLYAREQKRHWCIEQSYGLCGRGRRWDDLREWHWNMYNITYEMNPQPRFDAWYSMLGAGALGWPRGMVWGGRSEGGSGWGTRVHPWQFTYFSSLSFSFNKSANDLCLNKIFIWSSNLIKFEIWGRMSNHLFLLSNTY